jgi:TATA element modulatory factor
LIGIAGVSRSASTSSRTNDRLQERLAKAIAAKNIAQRGERPDSLALSSATPSRTGSPVTAPDSPRRSIDVVPSPTAEEKDTGGIVVSQPLVHDTNMMEVSQGKLPSISIQPGTPGDHKASENQEDVNGATAALDSEPAPRLSTESNHSSIPRDSLDSTGQGSRSSTEIPTGEITDKVLTPLKTPAEYEALLQQLHSDFEISEVQRQEEVHDYVERIDALQSKLQYLAKESADTARKSSGAAPGGSLEKKLADKEEQVALLMEEGQKLSKKELTQMTTIKKLRAKIQEHNKEVAETKIKQEKAEKDVAALTERLRRAEASEKRLGERQKQITQLQKENDSLRAERDARDLTISDLKKQLDEATAQEKLTETKMAHEALEAERRRVADLEDDLANAKIEKSLASDRAQAQIKDLRERMDKDAERARVAELEAKTEQHMLESKLEVMRARAEEASSGATGDAQAKLLRQIETLQTQYAVANENWQGIEASLLARATSLEKERDEATRREADIRRKAREVVCYISPPFKPFFILFFIFSEGLLTPAEPES